MFEFKIGREKKQDQPKTPQEVFAEMSEKQQNLAERKKALDAEYRELTAQTTMQGIFADVGIILEANGETLGQERYSDEEFTGFKDFEVEYNGQPAIAEVEDYIMDNSDDTMKKMENSVRIYIFDPNTQTQLVDLGVSKEILKPWKASMLVPKDGLVRPRDRYVPTNARPASGLFEGSREFGLSAEREWLPEGGIENGLHPTVISVAHSMKALAERLRLESSPQE